MSGDRSGTAGDALRQGKKVGVKGSSMNLTRNLIQGLPGLRHKVLTTPLEYNNPDSQSYAAEVAQH